MVKSLRIAFVAGLSDKKLAQKLAPLQALAEVESIDLFRRRPFSGHKVRWVAIPPLVGRIPALSEVWRVLTLFRNARKYDGVIGCHQRFHGIYAALAGFLFNRPVIQLTITDPRWIEKTPLGGWSLRGAVGVGFRGQTTLERYRQRYGDGQALFVVNNLWEAPSGKRLNTEKRIDLLFVGYHQGYKQLDVWLRVAAAVKSTRGSICAAWVGDRPRRSLRRAISRLGLKDDLMLLGDLQGEELDLCYSQSRVLLLTSRWEGMPMAALEAMSLGVPVVATDTGDTAELVKDGETGFLVSVDDVEGTALAVGRLLKDDALAVRMGDRARSAALSVAARSSLESTAAVWRAILRQVAWL